MSSPETPSKYGVPLTHDAWKGWPLRVGRLPGQGRVEELVARDDTILIWSGGRSEVTLHAHKAGARSRDVTTQRYVRSSGMIDFLPRGTTLDEVRWQGQSSGCISVVLERDRVERLLGASIPPLDADRGFRVNVGDAHVVDIVRRLETQVLAGEPWGALYVEGLSLTLASYVYGRYGGETETRLAEGRLAAIEAERLAAFIEDHLHADIGLTDLARVSGYSPDHLTRLFREAFGVPPYQYVLARRIERAKALLRDRGQSIAEVALTCGFASQSHFSAAFKARTGMTPGAYRRG